ncbi:MAG TPA: regulatory protein RecX [Solirubrobacterales bacterium]|nr:regulatory protein RecX [Solirubrobacterales bacterium]
MGTQEAFERALEALARKERTSAELTAWLAERGFGADEVDAALARLIEDGAIDDERFARRFAEDKRELRGWGPDRIREALAAKGLERELIEAEVGAEDPGAQLTRAIELLERRGGPPDDEAGRARALAYLARRGYDSELAYEAVRGFERRAA